MELADTAMLLEAFYRLVGTDSDDQALVAHGEAVDEVAYIFLTRGIREAQRWMIQTGYGGWRKRSSAISWTGSDSADGGRYEDLPTDWLRLYGNRRRSALVEPNGDRWGKELDEEEDHQKGDFYYVKGEELWLGRTATPPTTLYIDYHYRHEAIAAGVTIVFPEEARALIPALAAVEAKGDYWLPGGRELEAKIESAERTAKKKARHVARQTKNPRTFRKPVRHGNRW